MTPRGERLSRATRVAMALAAAALVAVLAIAAWLRPDPRGHGTHTQLGLPPCAFATLTGLRCPACGLTTAFAWIVRGRFDRAVEANPAGALLALAIVPMVPWLLASAAAARPRWGARSIDGPLMVMTVAAVAVGLAAWTLRIFLGRAHG